MLDFLFRRGNPTNGWNRSNNLTMVVSLDQPTINGVRLGDPFDALSSLGRNDTREFEFFGYLDYGIGISKDENDALSGFMVILRDQDGVFPGYNGELSWKQTRFGNGELNRDKLIQVLGDWYWLDSDDEELIAFYEFPDYEIQFEMDPSGTVNRIVLTDSHILGDEGQRKSYGVNKPWPPFR